MHDMTAGNLRSACGGESMARMRYTVWGGKAQADGYPNVARLFRAIAAAEEVHGANHFKAMAKVGGAYLVSSMAGFGHGSTSENLQGGIEGEMFEIREMYPAYLHEARRQGERAAERSFNYALEAEKTHAAMFTRAKAAVDAGNDVASAPVQVCDVCGYTVEGEAPGRCPICNAVKKRFVTFE